MKTAKTRAEFINITRNTEARFFGSVPIKALVALEIGPWVCPCGFRTRSAGLMWDHIKQTHEEEP
jgi:hypothetical protein